MTRRAKPIEKPRPQIGDFVARDISGWCICKMTGPGYWDFRFFGSACATQEGAEKLAVLMNAARDLAKHSQLYKTTSMYRGTDPKLWAMHCIVSAVSSAIDGPQPELFHEFLQRRDHEHCEACKPEPLEVAC
jgi:hypothetical protein